MNYTYFPKGVCSQKYEFEIVDNVVVDMKITGGCNGNTQALSILCKGLNIDDIISKLNGIHCGFKNTSCPDQVSQALIKYKNETN